MPYLLLSVVVVTATPASATDEAATAGAPFPPLPSSSDPGGDTIEILPGVVDSVHERTTNCSRNKHVNAVRKRHILKDLKVLV